MTLEPAPAAVSASRDHDAVVTEPTSGSRAVVNDSASSAVWTMASRVTGFARVIVIGAVFGPTYVANLFHLANQLPWLLFEITVGSLLGSLLVPALMAHIGDDPGAPRDADALGRLASAMTSVVALTFGGIAIVVMLATPLVSRVFALGVPDAVRDDLIGAGTILVLLTAPQLVGYGLTVAGQSIQQAMGQYAWPAAAGMIENVVMIAALVVYAVVFETGTEVVVLDTPRLLVLGLGSSAAVAAHVVLQWWGVRRVGIRLRPTWGFSHPEVRRLLGRAVAAMGTAALNGVRLFVVLIAANSLAGGTAALQLGLNLIGVAVALGAKPVAYAVLPQLALRFGVGDLTGYRDDYERGVGLAALVAVPAAIAALSLGWLLGPALAIGEMSNESGRALLLVTVTLLGGAVIGEALHQLAVAAAYGRDDARSPLLAFVVRLVITVVGVGLALRTGGDLRLGLIVVALSAGDLISSVLLHRWATRGLPRGGSYRLGMSVLRTTGAAAVGFGAAAGLAVLAGTGLDLTALAIPATLVAGGLGAALTLGLRFRLDDEVRTLITQFRGGAA